MAAQNPPIEQPASSKLRRLAQCVRTLARKAWPCVRKALHAVVWVLLFLVGLFVGLFIGAVRDSIKRK